MDKEIIDAVKVLIAHSHDNPRNLVMLFALCVRDYGNTNSNIGFMLVGDMLVEFVKVIEAARKHCA